MSRKPREMSLGIGEAVDLDRGIELEIASTRPS
jgi:hypothetical protein